MRRCLLVLALLGLVACSGRSSETAPRTPSTNAPTTTTIALAPTASDPAGLGRQLTALDADLRDPATPSTLRPALGRAHLVAVRKLVANPTWLNEVLARVPEPLQLAVRNNLSAQLLQAELAPKRTQPPPWTIVAPRPGTELLAAYHDAETETGVPWNTLAAVNLVETRMGRIRSASSAGALGPMQFLPSTWAQYGEGGDIQNDDDAIHAAARLLKANGAPADIGGALYRYNPASQYVKAVQLYAEVIGNDERAFSTYYHWPVLVHLESGDVILKEGGGVEPVV
jgi:hypothetical protein